MEALGNIMTYALQRVVSEVFELTELQMGKLYALSYGGSQGDNGLRKIGSVW